MSFSRRRVIALLTLTTILLVTIDMRGSSTLNSVKRVFNEVLSPLQDAGRAAAKPFQRAWRGIAEYDDLRRDNERLRALVDAQTGDQLAAQVVQQEYDQLQRLNKLEVDYSTVTAQVLSYSAQNFAETVEINRGTADGLEVGMPVRSAAGLVGRVTLPLTAHRATVMLITDNQYAVAVKILGAVPVQGSAEDPNMTSTSTTPASPEAAPPAGAPIGGIDSLPPLGGDGPDGAALPVLPDETTTTIAPTTTTTTPATSAPLSALPQRELGLLQGQGAGGPPIVGLVDASRRALMIKEGDIVATSGGCPSVAPADLPIGVVSKITPRPGSQGPLIEITPSADLDRLNFVVVVLYRPATQVSGETCS